MLNRLVSRLRRTKDSAPKRRARFQLEALEERFLLYATSGGQFAKPELITYSFIPDGTNVGGVSSRLFSTLNADYPTATWQLAFQKAAAIWEDVANVNLAAVADNGAAIGSTGAQQGDTRFGDIRIGAVPLPNSTLAIAYLPAPYNGGTAAGDLFFNSNINWGSTGYDIETVAIHELGHSLGMSHSAIATADMYANYNGVKQTLTADDIAGMQSIYSAVPSNGANNGSFATATNLTTSLNGSGQVTVTGQSIRSTTNVAFFSVTAPSNTTGTMTIVMQSNGLSSLSPRFVVYNGAEKSLGQATSTSLGATITLSFSGVTAGATYYIKAMDDTTGPGSIGAYALQVNFGSSALPAVPEPNSYVAPAADQGASTAADTSPPPGHHNGLLLPLLNFLLVSLLGDDILLDVGNLIGWVDPLTIGARQLAIHQAREHRAAAREAHHHAHPQPSH